MWIAINEQKTVAIMGRIDLLCEMLLQHYFSPSVTKGILKACVGHVMLSKSEETVKAGTGKGGKIQIFMFKKKTHFFIGKENCYFCRVHKRKSINISLKEEDWKLCIQQRDAYIIKII